MEEWLYRVGGRIGPWDSEGEGGWEREKVAERESGWGDGERWDGGERGKWERKWVGRVVGWMSGRIEGNNSGREMG